jgi:hypothetical protein
MGITRYSRRFVLLSTAGATAVATAGRAIGEEPQIADEIILDQTLPPSSLVPNCTALRDYLDDIDRRIYDAENNPPDFFAEDRKRLKAALQAAFDQGDVILKSASQRDAEDTEEAIDYGLFLLGKCVEAYLGASLLEISVGLLFVSPLVSGAVLAVGSVGVGYGLYQIIHSKTLDSPKSVADRIFFSAEATHFGSRLYQMAGFVFDPALTEAEQLWGERLFRISHSFSLYGDMWRAIQVVRSRVESYEEWEKITEAQNEAQEHFDSLAQSLRLVTEHDELYLRARLTALRQTRASMQSFIDRTRQNGCKVDYLPPVDGGGATIGPLP